MLYNDSLDEILTRLSAALNLVSFEDVGLGHVEDCEIWRRMLR